MDEVGSKNLEKVWTSFMDDPVPNLSVQLGIVPRIEAGLPTLYSNAYRLNQIVIISTLFSHVYECLSYFVD